MSTPNSQLLSPSSASPDHFGGGGVSGHHLLPAGEPSLAGSSELHGSGSESQAGVNTSLGSLKTEYKSKFTPFDQYVYNELTDSFVRPPSASPVGASIGDHLLLTPGGYSCSPDVQRDLCSRASSTEQAVAAQEPWYKEVQRRNEKANEYRFKSEVGHGSGSSQATHNREEYKRDHLISHLANNNNFNLPKETNSNNNIQQRNTRATTHVSSARSTTRTPAQVRSKSQSVARKTQHPISSTRTTTSTTKNLNLTPTRAPTQRQPLTSRPSPNIVSSTTKTLSKNNNSVDVRRPLNTSTSSRTAANRVTANNLHDTHSRPSTTSSISNKRPTTASSSTTSSSRLTKNSRQPISSSPAIATHRNNLSSTSSRTHTSTLRSNNAAKTNSNGNGQRTPTPDSSTPVVKSIKTNQAASVATATAAATTAAALLDTSESDPKFGLSDTQEVLLVKKEVEKEPVPEKNHSEEVSSDSTEPAPIDVTKMQEEAAEIIPAPAQVDDTLSFINNATNNGKVLADELAEAIDERSSFNEEEPVDEKFDVGESREEEPSKEGDLKVETVRENNNLDEELISKDDIVKHEESLFEKNSPEEFSLDPSEPALIEAPINVMTKPEETSWIAPALDQVDDTLSFINNTTNNGKVLADELAEAIDERSSYNEEEPVDEKFDEIGTREEEESNKESDLKVETVRENNNLEEELISKDDIVKVEPTFEKEQSNDEILSAFTEPALVETPTDVTKMQEEAAEIIPTPAEVGDTLSFINNTTNNVKVLGDELAQAIDERSSFNEEEPVDEKFDVGEAREEEPSKEGNLKVETVRENNNLDEELISKDDIVKQQESPFENNVPEEISVDPSEPALIEAPINVMTKPEETSWIAPSLAQVDDTTSFIFRANDTDNMLAQESAEAEPQKQQTITVSNSDESYSTNTSPPERKLSLDMDKNTLERKLSSKSSSSSSSTSSSASSSLERVVLNDIKSDYEELASRMTTDLISSGGTEGALVASGDLFSGSSQNLSQSSMADNTSTLTPLKLSDTTTTTATTVQTQPPPATTTTLTNLLD